MCSVAHGGPAALSALLLPAAQHCEVRDNVEPYYYCVMFNMDLACSASSRRLSPLSSSPTLLQMGGQNSISGSRVHACMHACTGAMMRAIRTSSSPSTLAILSCLARLPVRSASLLSLLPPPPCPDASRMLVGIERSFCFNYSPRLESMLLRGMTKFGHFPTSLEKHGAYMECPNAYGLRRTFSSSSRQELVP